MFSYTSLRIVNLVYNKTDIPLQLEEYLLIIDPMFTLLKNAPELLNRAE